MNKGFLFPLSKYANKKTGKCKICGRIKFLQPATTVSFCPTEGCPNYRKYLVKVEDIAH